MDCKYIVLDRGSAIREHLTQLRNHFDTQGTPVMIGGGVLAFTCLGVSREEAGEPKLLILVGMEVMHDIRTPIIVVQIAWIWLWIRNSK